MKDLGIAGKLAKAFIQSKLTPLIIAASVLLGIGAVVMLPREEEPQIIVPMVDVMVQMPGASSDEVEQRVTKPIEKLLWEIPGVEYIYSTSSPGASIVIVRFKVGQNEEDALVHLNQKLFSNVDQTPFGASSPLVKQRSIDDVPILALTLSSADHDHFLLRRVAAQVSDQIKEVTDVSDVQIIGVNYSELPEAVIKFDDEFGINYPLALDRTGEVTGSYKLTGLPELSAMFPTSELIRFLNLEAICLRKVGADKLE